ncbi:LysR family transcriptional regulator [Curtobacterium pusillum]|uniref:LysR family transcriptional regulator n=1 Tax=Curtobacterium pusillum TaxID=69373 RepID=A0ABX2M4S4_9MICO|nr:LysR family transcriptional regulator [Curtobacterium pusillum]NUU12564.1 LysR family transcriptional regulator [Curtobacterium pusillum]GLK30198.1 LysR family transcriptional regulator [Curtobacterium pusillum]
MPELPLDALHVLSAVADSGSVAAASARLGVSPQAVSARVRAVERRVGVRLFDRTTSGMSPTDDGRRVTAWADELLAAAAVFADRLDSLTPGPGRRIRVAASLTVAEHLVPSWMVESAATGDVVDLAVVNSSEVVERVRNGTVDLGFVETTDVPTDLESRVVARDELVLVVPPGHELARTGGVRLADLAAMPLIAREAGSGTRTSFERLCAEHGIARTAPPLHVVPTSAGVRAAVIAGTGPAVLSVLAVRDDIALGRVTQVRVEDVRLVRPLSAVWRSGSTLTGLARDFLDVALRTSAPGR